VRIVGVKRIIKGKHNRESGSSDGGDLEVKEEAVVSTVEDILGRNINDSREPDSGITSDLIVERGNTNISSSGTANLEDVILGWDGEVLGQDRGNLESRSRRINGSPFRNVISRGDSNNKSKNDESFHS